MSDTKTCFKCGASFQTSWGNLTGLYCMSCIQHKEEMNQRDEALRFQKDQASRSEMEADRARYESRAASEVAADVAEQRQRAGEEAARKAVLDEQWLRRDCPHCAESIKKAAKLCPHCRTELSDVEEIKASVAQVEAFAARLQSAFGARDTFHPELLAGQPEDETLKSLLLEELRAPETLLELAGTIERLLESGNLEVPGQGRLSPVILTTRMFEAHRAALTRRHGLSEKVEALGYPSLEEGLRAFGLWEKHKALEEARAEREKAKEEAEAEEQKRMWQRQLEQLREAGAVLPELVTDIRLALNRKPDSFQLVGFLKVAGAGAPCFLMLHIDPNLEFSWTEPVLFLLMILWVGFSFFQVRKMARSVRFFQLSEHAHLLSALSAVGFLGNVDVSGLEKPLSFGSRLNDFRKLRDLLKEFESAPAVEARIALLERAIEGNEEAAAELEALRPS